MGDLESTLICMDQRFSEYNAGDGTVWALRLAEHVNRLRCKGHCMIVWLFPSVLHVCAL